VRAHSQDERGRILSGLHDVATARGQTLPQLALQWILRRPEITSAVVGVSRVEQLESNVAALEGPELTGEELARIDELTLEQ
jgi:L-glyceraldehyde 3-phosphate reductase